MRVGVPAPPESLVGRAEELDSLRAALTTGQRVVIVGTRETPGVGRTALARAVASDDAVVSPHGTFRVALGWSLRRDGRRPHVALAAWLRALGAPLAGSASLDRLVQALRAALSTRGRALLVIDGVTSSDVGTVTRLLQRLPPEVGAVLTADDLAVARSLGLSALPLVPLSEDEGIELLERTTGSAVPAVIAGAMLAAVAYLPLGVVIAGSRLRRATSEESGSWGGEVDPRRAQRLGGPLGLARSFLDVYRRLGEASGRVLRALGACSVGPVTADRVAGLLGLAPDIAKAELTRLEQSGLLVRLSDAEWDVHPLMVSFARQLLEEAGEADRLAKRRVSAVLQSEGAATEVVPAAEILEVCDEAVLAGHDEDVVALATRVSEGMAAWCVEGSLSLVRAAADATARSRSRAQGVVRSRREAVERMAAAASVAEGDLAPPPRVVEGDPDDPFERGTVAPVEAPAPAADALSRRTAVPLSEREPAFPSVVPAAPAQRADPNAWWVVRSGAEAAAEVAPAPAESPAETSGAVAVRRITGATDGALYGIARHVAAAHGDSDAEVRAGCLGRARDAAATITTIHERLADQIERAERDVRGRQDPSLREPLDRLSAATRQVVDALRAARAAAPVIEHAGDLERMRRAAERAERARDEAGVAADDADAAWTALQDALSDVQAAHARRRVMLVRGRTDATQARALFDEASTKIRAWRLTYEGDDAWHDVDTELDAARKAADRADIALGGLESAPDPDAFGAAVTAARAEAEQRTRAALAVATRRVEVAREAARAREHRREVGEHADRAERGARAFEALYARMSEQLKGTSTADALALSRRVELLATRVQRARRLAKDAQEASPGRAAHDAVDRLAAAARDVMTCVAEAERLAADVETWNNTSSDLAVEQVRMEALGARWVALVGVEGTAAVARRASSRANLVAAAMSDADVRRIVAQLEAQEVELREVLDTARASVEGLEDQRGLAFEVGIDGADEAIERATSHADRARQLAESLLELVDGQRRAAVLELRGDGRALADRVARCHAEMSHVHQELSGAWTQLGAEGATWRTTFAAASERVADAQRAVDDGLERLLALSDPQLLSRIVDAMQDAVDVAAAAVIESESLRVKVRGAVARAPARTVDEDEVTDPRVSDVTMGRIEVTASLDDAEAQGDEPTLPSIEVRERTEQRVVVETTAPGTEGAREVTFSLADEATGSEPRTQPGDDDLASESPLDATLVAGAVALGRGEPEWQDAAGSPPPSDLVPDTFDDFDAVSAPVSDEDLASVEASVAAALSGVDEARAAFARARTRAGAGDEAFAAAAEAHALLVGQADALVHDVGASSHERAARAAHVRALGDMVRVLAAQVVRPVAAPSTPPPAPVFTVPTPPAPAPVVDVATLAGWAAAVEAWSAGWSDARVVAAAAAARDAIGHARAGGSVPEARRAVDALAVEVDDASRARRAAWHDASTREAGAARAALAALREGQLSTAAELSDVAATSSATEVRCAVALVWHAIGRVGDAAALVADLPEDVAVSRVRAVLASPSPSAPDVLASSGLAARAARLAIHRSGRAHA